MNLEYIYVVLFFYLQKSLLPTLPKLPEALQAVYYITFGTFLFFFDTLLGEVLSMDQFFDGTMLNFSSLIGWATNSSVVLNAVPG
jgi:hypothetical protein